MTASPAYMRSEVRITLHRSERTGVHILPVHEPTRIRDYAFTSKKVVLALATARRLARRHTKGPDAVRVTEADDTEPGEHRDTRIRALALFHKIADGGEDIFFVDTELARLLEIVGKDVEQQLGVRGRVDVPVGRLVHELEQLVGVDEITILCCQVSNGEARRRVDERTWANTIP